MARAWPAGLTIIKIDVAPIRPADSTATPITSLDSYDASAYSKHEATVYYRPVRQGASRLVTSAFAAQSLAPVEGVRVPLANCPLKAKTTGAITATGANNTLNLVSVSGGTAKSKINGGAGFYAGQVFSLIHNGVNYLYSVAEDQVTDAILLTSRLRGGPISSAVALAIDTPYIEGRIQGKPSLEMQSDKLVEFSMTVVERG